MGVMDKFLNYMKLNDNDSDEDGYYDSDYDEEESMEPKTPSVVKRMNTVREEVEEVERPIRKVQPSSNKITQMRQTTTKRVPTGTGMEVCVMKPVSIDEAREITDTLLSNRTVVLNLEGIDTDVAQRIVDFASGSCYAINGNLQKISHYIFIITPSSVDISGDFPELLGGAYDSPIGGGLN